MQGRAAGRNGQILNDCAECEICTQRLLLFSFY